MCLCVLQLSKLFTHMTELFVVANTGGSEMLELAFSVKKEDLYPSVAIRSGEQKEETFVLSKPFEVSSMKVSFSPCSFMQPLAFVKAQYAGHDYHYPTTSHECTFIDVELPDLSMKITMVPAAHEKDSVGQNYFNLNIQSLRHTKAMRGILSHCDDGSLKFGEDDECPQCFKDQIYDIRERSFQSHEQQDIQFLESSFSATGDHPFKMHRMLDSVLDL